MSLQEKLQSDAKKYILKYNEGNDVELLTDAELLNFIKVAVIKNRDIKKFEIIEIP